MSAFLRVIRFAIQNFLRNAWLSLVTISVLVICLIAVNIMISVGYIKTMISQVVQDRVNVTVSLTKESSTADADMIAADLDKQANVDAVAIVTPEESLARFKNRFKEISDKILPALDANPLGYKVEVKMRDSNSYSQLLTYLQQASYKDKIQSQNFVNYQLFINSLTRASDIVNKVALGIALLFLCLGIMVVFNTIRVSIYTQRDEVGIMKLVGATNWFIRGPFLIEAVFYSLIATLVTFIIVYPAIQIFSLSPLSQIEGFNFDLMKLYQRDFWLLFSVQFVALAVINIVSTFMALRKYLRV